MASTDSKPVPRKNEAYRAYFDILDADGDPVTGAAGLDSEKSLDGAAFSDCTNEATEIANGFYYLDLTAAEMNADCVCIAIKTSTSGAKQTDLIFYPKEAGDMPVSLEDNALTAAAIASNAITDAKIATGAITAGKFAAGAIDASAIADNAIDAGAIAANAITDAKINAAALTAAKFGAGAISATVFSQGAADLVWGSAARTLTSFGTLIADIWANATRTLSSYGTLIADIWAYATRGLTDKAGFAISGTKQTLDALNDITAASVWAVVSRTLTAAVDINSNSDITAIKLKTDSLAFTLAGKVDSNILAINGALTNDNLATLKLKSLNIQNNSGSAFISKSSGGGASDYWYGMEIAGSGKGEGAKINGGDQARCGAQINGGQIGAEFTNAMNESKLAFASDYAGIFSQGITTNKPGAIFQGSMGIFITANGNDPEYGSAISLKAVGLGSGVYSRGGTSGYGIDSNIHGSLDGSVDSVSTAVNINSNTDITAIKAKTDLITGAPALETTAQSIKAKTDLIPAAPATEGTSLAIKAKTDLIPASPASETTSAAIKAKTDLLPADPSSEAAATANKAAIQLDIDALPTATEIDSQLSGAHGSGAWNSTSADLADTDGNKTVIAKALVEKDISALSVNANSIYRVIQKMKTVLLNPIRWDFTGLISKIIYKNEAGTVTEAEANIYKDNGTTKPLNSGQVSTRDKVTFS